MTEEQKTQITQLRTAGFGYFRVAQVLGISENTVKSYCRRNNLNGTVAVKESKTQNPVDDGIHLCICCSLPVEQNPRRKEKKFCSDKCRMKWWNNNLDRVKHKAMYKFICPYCGKSFTVYGNSHRKYCSHECYVAARFGGVQDE